MWGQYNLVGLYSDGAIAESDYAAALEWARKAQQNNPPEQIAGALQEYVGTLQKLMTLPKPTVFEISVAGSPVKVSRIGTGAVGVIFFPHTGARAMNKSIFRNQDWLKDIIPEKCSFYLWEYPQSAPFDKVMPTLDAYRKDDSAKLPLPGIAESVVAQIRQKSGLNEFLLIGNSLGAGIVLQGYAQLVKDPSLSFLLVSPTAPFLPAPETIPKLERTVLIGSKGYEENDGKSAVGSYGVPRFSTDHFLHGKDANPEDKEWHWFRKNQNSEWGDLIAQSQAEIPERVVGTTHYTKPTDFSSGHKTIGSQITNELLSKMIQVQMGWADKVILREPPKQPNPAYPYYPVSGVGSP